MRISGCFYTDAFPQVQAVYDLLNDQSLLFIPSAIRSLKQRADVIDLPGGVAVQSSSRKSFKLTSNEWDESP